MSVKQFYAELKKGLTGPAYLLHADEAGILKEAVMRIRHSVPPEEMDFKYHAYDLEGSDGTPPLEQIIDTLNTVPFMGGTQTVVLENLQKLKAADMKPLVEYFKSPSPDSLLVMTYSGKPRKTMLNKLTAIKDISISIQERDLPFWIKERAAERGLELTTEAINYLIGTVGTDAGLLASEVEKFATLAGDGKKLGKDDIAMLVTGSREHSPFELVDALRAGNAKRAFSIYTILSQTQEAYGLLGVLNWHYGRLQMAPREKARVFGLLNEADMMVKSAGGAYPLEHLLAKLLQD